MKENSKNRFLIWAIFAVPIFLTGWFSLFVWTVIQIVLAIKDDEQMERINNPIPLEDRPHIVEMNKPENLSEKDKEYLAKHPQWVKVGEGAYALREKKKQ